MRDFKFYKELAKENYFVFPKYRWYVDLPEWGGSKEDLEMIEGADTMLDIISQGENNVILTISLEFFNSCDVLEKIEDTPSIGGALYIMKYYNGVEYNLQLWLCDVTKFVFGYLPEKIYIK